MADLYECGLLWFRSDLRLDDNRAAAFAAASCRSLICLYVWPDRYDRHTPRGFSRTGPYRRAFFRESVAALAEAITARGGCLTVRRGDPAAIAQELARLVGGFDLLLYEEHPVREERAEAERLERALEAVESRRTLEVRRVDGRPLYRRESLPFSPAAMPLLFTDFRKAVEGGALFDEPVAPPGAMPAPPAAAGALRSDDLDSGILPSDTRASFVPRGGEAAAAERLSQWIWEGDHLRHYKQTRNGLLGATFSSRLSPWLAHGCISARRVAFEIERYERERVANESTYWLRFELIWRDYYHYLALRFPREIFLLGGPMERHRAWVRDRDLFRRWCSGSTGEPLVDAAMRELAATGWMSNRARQNVASYLAHDLMLPWTWGAEWFEHLLVDYDPASNWGNWTYVAGVGTDPRRDRRFDPERQAERYDPDGSYRRVWGG